MRYADDFVVLTRTEEEAYAARADVDAALAGLRLRLNARKTRVTCFDWGFRFLGVDFVGDQYAYACGQKRVVVEGPTTRILHNYRPEFY